MSAGERVGVLASIQQAAMKTPDRDLMLNLYAAHSAVAELVAADREYDEAMAAWETLDTRRSLGDYEDSRDYEGPVARRRQDARVRRLRAIAALQVTP